MADSDRLAVLPNACTFPKVKLMAPSPHGYVLAGFGIDRRQGLLYWLESGGK